MRTLQLFDDQLNEKESFEWVKCCEYSKYVHFYKMYRQSNQSTKTKIHQAVAKPYSYLYKTILVECR